MCVFTVFRTSIWSDLILLRLTSENLQTTEVNSSKNEGIPLTGTLHQAIKMWRFWQHHMLESEAYYCCYFQIFLMPFPWKVQTTICSVVRRCEHTKVRKVERCWETHTISLKVHQTLWICVGVPCILCSQMALQRNGGVLHLSIILQDPTVLKDSHWVFGNWMFGGKIRSLLLFQMFLTKAN